jgi:hypothetical protein
MKKEFLPLACVGPISLSAGQTALADVVSPTEVVVGFSLGVLIPISILVAVVVIVSILVIRAIKKNRTPKDKI